MVTRLKVPPAARPWIRKRMRAGLSWVVPEGPTWLHGDDERVMGDDGLRSRDYEEHDWFEHSRDAVLISSRERRVHSHYFLFSIC